ncbi:MAG: hypothetical protein ACI9WS_003484 [Paraglaciecola psychrophila]|jgi:hypothetical protein
MRPARNIKPTLIDFIGAVFPVHRLQFMDCSSSAAVLLAHWAFATANGFIIKLSAVLSAAMHSYIINHKKL